MLPHLHGYFISVHSCLRGSSQLLASYGNQEGSFGSGLLDGRSNKPVDKLLHDDLAGECLGDFDYRLEIELFDRGFDRAGLTRQSLFVPQVWIELLKLPYLAIGSPTKICLPCVPQIDVRELLETPPGVEAGGQLVGERLVVDK